MLKVGIVGCGGIARTHAAAYRALGERVRVVAVADVDERAAKELAGYVGGRAHTDYREILKSEDVDVVDICLPHRLHRQVVLESLEAGKHTLCEKPIATNISEAREVYERVKASDKKFMPAHNQIFVPAVQEAKRLVEEGLVGKVLFIRTQDCFVNTGIVGWRTRREEMGGGELVDTGYHPTYLMNFFSRSKARTVYAVGTKHRINMEGEDSAFVTLEFEDGSVGNIHSSWAFENPSNAPLFTIVGERGQLYGGHFSLSFKPVGMSEAKREWQPNKNSFALELEHFLNCVENDKEPIQTAEDGLNTMRIIDAAYRSMSSGRRVEVDWS